jgi:hypothetical protein
MLEKLEKKCRKMKKFRVVWGIHVAETSQFPVESPNARMNQVQTVFFTHQKSSPVKACLIIQVRSTGGRHLGLQSLMAATVGKCLPFPQRKLVHATSGKMEGNKSNYCLLQGVSALRICDLL